MISISDERWDKFRTVQAAETLDKEARTKNYRGMYKTKRVVDVQASLAFQA